MANRPLLLHFVQITSSQQVEVNVSDFDPHVMDEEKEEEKKRQPSQTQYQSQPQYQPQSQYQSQPQYQPQTQTNPPPQEDQLEEHEEEFQGGEDVYSFSDQKDSTNRYNDSRQQEEENRKKREKVVPLWGEEDEFGEEPKKEGRKWQI